MMTRKDGVFDIMELLNWAALELPYFQASGYAS